MVIPTRNFAGRYARRFIEPMLLALARRDRARLLATSGVHVLCYHRVRGAGLDGLARHVDALRREMTLVPYGEAAERARRGPIDRAMVAMTFDDGLEEHLDAGRVLSASGVRACFFVCAGWIGLGPERAGAEGRERLGFHGARFLDVSGVRELVRLGHEVGCHSMTHADVSTLDHSGVDSEIVAACDKLREVIGGGAVHFAWPYGRFARFSRVGCRAAERSRCVSIASAERGMHARERGGAGVGSCRVCIRRELVEPDEPPERVLDRLALRAWLWRTDGRWPSGLR